MGAAVNIDGGASNIGAAFGQQKGDEFGDFVGLPNPLQAHVYPQIFQVLSLRRLSVEYIALHEGVESALGALGLGNARAHAVGANALRTVGEADVFRDIDDARFARGIGK